MSAATVASGTFAFNGNSETPGGSGAGAADKEGSRLPVCGSERAPFVLTTMAQRIRPHGPTSRTKIPI